MTYQVRSEGNSLQELFQEIYAAISPQDDLGVLRVKAWNLYLEMGLPSRKSEVFRYVPLRGLFAKSLAAPEDVQLTFQEIEDHLLPECADSFIVFINGYFQPQLSNLKGVSSKVVLQAIPEALQTFGGFFNSQWTKSLKEETDPFVILNAALHQKGAFLYLPPKTNLEKPIQILNVISASSPILAMSRLHIFGGAQSEAQFISSNVSLTKQTYLDNSVVEMHLEDDAHLKWFQDVNVEIDEAWHLNAYRAVLKKNSTLKMVGVTEGSQTVRTDYRIALVGENADALLNGLWMLSGKNEAHSHILIDHQAPHCHSLQLFKGVLSDFSRSSFEGKILVRQAAQKTDAFQLNNNLLLSERAHADSKPNLEIFADDVKASHGATIGQLDNEQLFYLKSRGFSSDTAKNLLVYGYCKEIIEMIPVPSLFEKIKNRAYQYLDRE